MALYPVITYFLANGEVQLNIPDLSVLIITTDEGLETINDKVINITSPLSEIARPSSFLELEFNPDKTIGVDLNDVESIHFDKMEIIPNNDLDSLIEFEKLREESLENNETDSVNYENLGKKVVINVEVSPVLLDMLEQKRINLSELIDNAIINELFY